MRSLFIHALALGALAGACTTESGQVASDGAAAGGDKPAAAAVDSRMAAMVAALPKVGSELPAISALTLDGRTIDNAALRGKTTLINLWFYH